MTHDCDLAIVGSGFGGSLLAMVARRIGLSVLLLERGQHPRFAIGESASPLVGVILEQLADRYDLPRLKPLASYGRWLRARPDLTCGLKRGFTFFRHCQGARYRADAARSNQLLVAASPSDEVSDTHWLRSDVDHFLVREATALGVGYLDRVSLDGAVWDAAGAPVLAGVREGRALHIRARAVVDASGPGGFLARALGIPSSGFDSLPQMQALYSHFRGVARCDEMPDYASDDTPPYPMDDAALHHVFDGGWMWVLRFGNGVTSAGFVVSGELACEIRLADGAPAWARLLARYPSIAAQFDGAEPIRDFTWMPRLSYRAAAAAGPRWAMLPSSAAFVDPLFSTGMPLTLLGVERLGLALEAGAFVNGAVTGTAVRRRDGESRDGRAADSADVAVWGPDSYQRATLDEADHTARLIAGCYAAFPRFDDFTAYSMFYFAAASFSEMARRLDRLPPMGTEPAGAMPRSAATAAGFLRVDDARFVEQMRTLSPSLRDGAVPGDLARRVADATAAVNIAGLCDRRKRNWYAVDLEETVRAAAKLGVSAEHLRAACAAMMRAV